MSKISRDVLIFDSEKMRANEMKRYTDAVCKARFVYTTADLKQELFRCRPNALVYVDSGISTRDLMSFEDAVFHPQFEYMPMILVADKEREEILRIHCPGKKIIFLDAYEDVVSTIRQVLEDLSKLPSALVVDGDSVSRNAFINCFEDTCICYDFADNDEALHFLAKQPVDIIFIDISQPHMSGLRLCEMIRDTENIQKIPIVFLIGNADKTTVMLCIQKKVDAYMVKPIYHEELQKKVSSILEHGKAFERKTVLIVDDDVVVLKTIQALLNTEYRVVALSSGEQAIKFCSKNVPDMILLDYEMPERNGIFVLRRLRQDKRFNNCPIVMLTGNSVKDTVIECIQAGAQGYLTKPVNPTSLRLRVRQYIGLVKN